MSAQAEHRNVTNGVGEIVGSVVVPESDALALVQQVRYGTDPGNLDVLFDTFDDLWAYRCAAQSIATAARKVIALIEGLMAEELGEHVVRIDDHMLSVKPDRTLKVHEKSKLFDFLGDDAREAFRAEDVRVTSLRAIAEKRARQAGMTDEDAIKKRVFTVVDSLIYYDEKPDGTLQVLPATKAPGYFKVLDPGTFYDKTAIDEVKKRSRALAKAAREHKEVAAGGLGTEEA